MHILCQLWSLCLLLTLSIKACEAMKLKSRYPESHHHGHHHPICFTNEDLEEAEGDIVQRFVRKNMQWNRYPAVNMVRHLENIHEKRRRRRREEEKSCPDLQTSTPSAFESLHDRSLSPWTYRIDVDENRYPQKLAFAQCLCHGCIDGKTGKEISSVNSVSIDQTMLVLRKKPCPHKSESFTFELEYLKVPVGCTCAIPKYS